MDKQLRKAFEFMMADKQVRITKEGRDFWTKGMHYHNIGQWFYIQAVRTDGIDICGVNHDSMEKMPIEYIKF
jgi:hypothetical protein